MTLKITSLGVAMALALAASASVAEKAPVPLKPSVACDVRLNVVDKARPALAEHVQGPGDGTRRL